MKLDVVERFHLCYRYDLTQNGFVIYVPKVWSFIYIWISFSASIACILMSMSHKWNWNVAVTVVKIHPDIWSFRTFLSQKMSKSLRKVVIQGNYKMINLPFLFLFVKVSVPIEKDKSKCLKVEILCHEILVHVATDIIKSLKNDFNILYTKFYIWI